MAAVASGVVCLRRISAWSAGELAVSRAGARLASFFSECSLHFYGRDSPNHKVLRPFLGGSGFDPALRANRFGAGVSLPLSDAQGGRSHGREGGELAFYCGSCGLEWVWNLSRPLFAVQQLGRCL